MFFLRVDYVSKGNGVMRIRSLHDSLPHALKALRDFGLKEYSILLVRIELCG